MNDSTPSTASEWAIIRKSLIGYSGSDLANIANTAKHIPIEELLKASTFAMCDDGFMMPITRANIGKSYFIISI